MSQVWITPSLPAGQVQVIRQLLVSTALRSRCLQGVAGSASQVLGSSAVRCMLNPGNSRAGAGLAACCALPHCDLPPEQCEGHAQLCRAPYLAAQPCCYPSTKADQHARHRQAKLLMQQLGASACASKETLLATSGHMQSPSSSHSCWPRKEATRPGNCLNSPASRSRLKGWDHLRLHPICCELHPVSNEDHTAHDVCDTEAPETHQCLT